MTSETEIYYIMDRECCREGIAGKKNERSKAAGVIGKKNNILQLL